MCRLYTIALLLLLSVRCFSQESKKSAPDAGKQVAAYIDSAKTWLPIDPQRSLYFTNKLLELSITSSNKYGELISYKLLANINYVYGKYDLAISYSNKIIAQLKNGYNSKDFYDVYKLLGLSYKAMNQAETSRQYFNIYLDNAKQYKDSLNIIDANNNIASLYLKQKKYDEAIELSQQNNSQQNRIIQNNSVGNSAAIGNNNAISSNVILSKAYYLKGEKDKAYDQLNSIGNQQLPNSVTELFFTSDSLLDKVSSQNGFVTPRNTDYIDLNNILQNKTNYDLGSQYLNSNNTQSAIPYLEKSVSISEQHGTLPERIKSLRALAEAYEKAGSTGKAADTYKKYAQLLEEQNSQDGTSAEQNSELSSMLDNINRKVQLLEQEKGINTKTIELLQKEQQLKDEAVSNRNVIIYAMLGLILVLSIIGYYMVKTVQQKRKANLMLELKSLRTQMNPHFIFNALNSVNSFIAQKDELTANRFLSSFSALTRSILQNAEADFITLDEEINLLQNYLKLEHGRFGDKFEYSFVVDPSLETTHIKIPPMLVQPFIENAIWHGLRYLDHQGKLDVAVKSEGGQVIMLVNDNGIGRERSQQQKTKNQRSYRSTGIRNISKRIGIINQVYKQDIKIDIEDLHAGAGYPGTSVKITIALNND